MQYAKYILGLAVVLLFACESNTIAKKPDHLIPEDQMVEIISDMYLSKAAIHHKNKYNVKFVNYHALLLKKHGIDSLQYQNSIAYYTADLNKKKAILEAVQKKFDEELLKRRKEHATETE